MNFTIRELLLLLTIVAISVLWWMEAYRPSTSGFDIQGPLSVRYEYRISENSRGSNQINGAKGIDFTGDHVVIHTNDGGTVLPASHLINLNWTINE